MQSQTIHHIKRIIIKDKTSYFYLSYNVGKNECYLMSEGTNIFPGPELASREIWVFPLGSANVYVIITTD